MPRVPILSPSGSRLSRRAMLGGAAAIGAAMSLPRLSHCAAQDASPVATPSPSGATTLLDVTVAALPAGQVQISAWRFGLPSGPDVLTMRAEEGLKLIGVETGAVGVTVNGTETTLVPGGQLAVADQEAQLRNTEAAEAVAFVVQVAASLTDAFEHESVVISWQLPIDSFAAELPAGLTRVVLERRELPPGATLPAYRTGEWEWLGVVQGTLGLTAEGERLPYPLRAGEERKIQAGLRQAQFPPGTSLVLRNAGDEPLVLWQLTITPAGAATPTA